MSVGRIAERLTQAQRVLERLIQQRRRELSQQMFDRRLAKT